MPTPVRSHHRHVECLAAAACLAAAGQPELALWRRSNITTVFTSLEEARAAKINNAEYFGSAPELAKLAASWPARRPVEIWNSFAGVVPFTSLKPVKKFPNRKAAVAETFTSCEKYFFWCSFSLL